MWLGVKIVASCFSIERRAVETPKQSEGQQSRSYIENTGPDNEMLSRTIHCSPNMGAMHMSQVV